MRRHLPGGQNPAVLVLLLLIPHLAGCGLLYPDPDPEMAEAKEGPLFQEDYYAQNAKEYFDAGQYGRAREQWEQQLRKSPDNWMARLGIAYCDYYIGARYLASRDLASGRKRLQQAEASFRELWSGELEEDAWLVDPKQPQWKAALGLAMALRGLGLADELHARLQAQRLAAVEPTPENAPRMAELKRSRLTYESRRDENYAASIALFERLAGMKSASPEAVKQLAELYLITEQDEKAEREFSRYLTMAETTAEMRQKAMSHVESKFNDPMDRRIAAHFLDQKLRSNARKRASVMVKLAGVCYSKGYTALQKARQASAPEERSRHSTRADEQFSKALDYLERARKIQPERLDLLVKMAQCQGELGLLDAAIDNLEQYITRSAQKREDYSSDLNQAYRLKRELELRRRARGR